MNKEQILASLKAKYPEKTTRELEAVSADVYYSGEPQAVLASKNIVDNLFKRLEEKQKLEVDAKNSVETNAYCPICKMATAAIKLDQDRPAKWCSRHFVVFPVKAGGE